MDDRRGGDAHATGRHVRRGVSGAARDAAGLWFATNPQSRDPRRKPCDGVADRRFGAGAARAGCASGHRFGQRRTRSPDRRVLRLVSQDRAATGRDSEVDSVAANSVRRALDSQVLQGFQTSRDGHQHRRGCVRPAADGKRHDRACTSRLRRGRGHADARPRDGEGVDRQTVAPPNLRRSSAHSGS